MEEVSFYSASLTLAQLAQPDFVAAYVTSVAATAAAAAGGNDGGGEQRGGFYALSVDSAQQLEDADAAALTPDGALSGPARGHALFGFTRRPHAPDAAAAFAFAFG